MLREPRLLLPISEKRPDYDLFRKAMCIAFDVPEGVMCDIVSYDFLWMPEPDPQQTPNYYTLAFGATHERDPVGSVLSYLFEAREPYYGEPYVRRPEERLRLEACHRRLRERYSTPDDYFGAVEKRLYRRDLGLRGSLGTSGAKRVATIWAESV
jgi:hypothetical protein